MFHWYPTVSHLFSGLLTLKLNSTSDSFGGMETTYRCTSAGNHPRGIRVPNSGPSEQRLMRRLFSMSSKHDSDAPIRVGSGLHCKCFQLVIRYWSIRQRIMELNSGTGSVVGRYRMALEDALRQTRGRWHVCPGSAIFIQVDLVSSSCRLDVGG